MVRVHLKHYIKKLHVFWKSFPASEEWNQSKPPSLVICSFFFSRFDKLPIMKINTRQTNGGSVFFLRRPPSQRFSWRIIGSVRAGPSPNLWTAALSSRHPGWQRPSLVAPRSSSQPRSSLPFWCQSTLVTRLNTYSGKTSKRCAAFQIHSG